MLVNLSCNFLKRVSYRKRKFSNTRHLDFILWVCCLHWSSFYSDFNFSCVIYYYHSIYIIFLINVTVSYKYEIKYIYKISKQIKLHIQQDKNIELLFFFGTLTLNLQIVYKLSLPYLIIIFWSLVNPTLWKKVIWILMWLTFRVSFQCQNSFEIQSFKSQ